jgi:hypothetical protein
VVKLIKTTNRRLFNSSFDLQMLTYNVEMWTITKTNGSKSEVTDVKFWELLEGGGGGGNSGV